MTLRAAALICTLAVQPAAGGILLAQPIDCILGQTCIIQNYVDRDPGPGAADFTCGALSYDGHKGTDFALPTRADMARGVDVLAAAPGTVRGTRDGMPDTGPQTPPPEGKDCGNGVVIDHGDGWQTQYCHMARGSVAVASGQKVVTGTVLGQVGLSGRTAFAHLHLSVRHNGAVVDPFQPEGRMSCTTAPDPDPDDTLWQMPPAYRGGGLIGAGFATEMPSFDAIKAGLVAPQTLPAEAPALVAWTHLFGARAGDVLTFALEGPDGPFAHHSTPLERTQARLFRAYGQRRPAGGWSPGPYRAEITLTRAGAIVGRKTTTVTIR